MKNAHPCGFVCFIFIGKIIYVYGKNNVKRATSRNWKAIQGLFMDLLWKKNGLFLTIFLQLSCLALLQGHIAAEMIECVCGLIKSVTMWMTVVTIQTKSSVVSKI